MIAISSFTRLLTYAIAVIGVLPLFAWLTTVPQTLLVVALAAGVWQDVRRRWLFKPWMQNSAVVPVFLYYATRYTLADAVQPVVSVLAVMMAVRVAGEKSIRHSLQIYALALFCLASSSLYSLSPLFLLYLGLLIILVALSLVLLTFQNQDARITVSAPQFRQIVISGLLLTVLSVPLLLLFFPLLPRTQLPMWNFLAQSATRSTGYSDTVEPGSQSSVTPSAALAFRAEMPRLAPAQLYWRATVLNRTDGLKWSRDEQIPAEPVTFAKGAISQIVFPEPNAVRTAVALDRPSAVTLTRVRQAPDGVFGYPVTAQRRMSYNAFSQPNGRVVQRTAVNRTYYLQTPAGLSPRLRQLGAAVAASGRTDADRLNYLEQYYRSGGFRYATSGLATGADALDQFLFEKKSGHCEFFASSFALLLRLAGVPCRLVGGFLGGEYNEVGGYYQVTEDKAHVWVEAFIDGSWLRIDPSSFAAESGRLWAASPRSVRLRMTMMLDSLNHTWNRSFITYDFDRQLNIAQQAGSYLQGISITRQLRIFFPYVIGGLAGVALLLLLRKAPLFRSREQRILASFMIVLRRQYGITAAPEREGLFAIAALVDDQRVADFINRYAAVVYHDRKLDDDEYRYLKGLIEKMTENQPKIS
jgi:hypothetical protein